MKAILTAVAFTAIIGLQANAGTELLDTAPLGFVHLRDKEKEYTADHFINVSHIVTITVDNLGKGEDRFRVRIMTTGTKYVGGSEAAGSTSQTYNLYYPTRKEADATANRIFKQAHSGK